MRSAPQGLSVAISDIEVHDLAALVVDDEEREDGPEHHVVELQEITSPNISDVVLEKGRPPLPCRRTWSSNVTRVFLDGSSFYIQSVNNHYRRPSPS